MKIHLRNNERVLIIGASGSGKTVLAKHFLKRLNRVFAIDPKHTLRIDGFKIRRNLPVFGKQFRTIYRPAKGGEDEDERLYHILDELFRMKNVTIYCDELSTLADRFPLATKNLADIARTGREINVSVWSCVQRPRYIPRVFLTEAESVFIFTLRGQEDRDYMSQFTDPIVREPIERFLFWYSHPDNDDVSLMRYNMQKNYIEKIG